MEEDVEIELLLKSTEKMLSEAANSVPSDNSDEEPIGLTNDDGEMVSEKIPQENMKTFERKGCKSRERVEHKLDLCIDDERNLLDKRENHLELLQNKSSADAYVKLRRESSYSDEVQELLDDRIVSCMSDEAIKYFVPLHSTESDDDTSDNETIFVDTDSYFINEIMADDEPEYRGHVVEQLREQVGNKSKQQMQNKTIHDLIKIQKLILERDDLLTKMEVKLHQCLQENEEKIKQIREVLADSRSSSKIKEPNYSRCFFKKFGMPYFEDSNGFPAPYNEDHIGKEKRGELIVTSIPKIHYWTKTHKEMFVDTVKQILKDENSQKLQNEINKLTNIIDNSLEVDEELVQKLTRCRDKLRTVRSLSYTDLVSQEDPDREYDWMRISASVFNRLHSPEECKRFWHIYLKPSVNKACWEISEDFKLLEIAEQMQYQDWDAIAKLLGTNRTAYQCLVHFQTRIHTKRDFSMGKWTKEEDTRLLSVINASKIGNFIPWTKVSSYMVNRTHNQIYNRWSNCLNPKLVKGKFTKEEDLLIVAGIEVFGMTFREMSSLITNRSCAQIRERYERHLHPKTAKTGTWSLEEDKKLLSLVQKHGEQNWVLVANDMKTRSRTQVRQRYGFIQHMMKTKPGWTVARVKRRHLNGISKALENTKKNVEKVKEEINKVEKVFKLTKLESDTFRIEKLKELRDKIMLKKFDLKRKKKVFSDSSEVNNLLLEYFKYSQVKPIVTPATFRNHCDSDAYLNEILMMAKYFGHELELPQCEDEIWTNPRLSHNLKCFLTETIDIRTGLPTTQSSVPDSSCSSSSFTCESNIDYIPPSIDDTLLMEDWWHTPPVDVTRLNFSEFFKRVIYDYTYGMHKDIWTAKINRSPVVNLSNFNETPDPSLSRQQPYYLPPNHLTTLGFRSLLLSRGRLRRDSSDKGFTGKLFPRPEQEEMSVKVDFELNNRLLQQFQETMITLFTWPKVLSVTNINSTPLTQTSGVRVIPIQPSHSSKIASLLNSVSEDVQYEDGQEVERKNESIKKERIRQTILEQTQDRKRHLLQYKRGISSGRKMKIEHLIKDLKQKVNETLSNSSNPVVRKRGRPPSNPSTPGTRKRGRPPKSKAPNLETQKKDRPPSNTSTPGISKRGMPYKSRNKLSNPYLVDNPTSAEVKIQSEPEQETKSTGEHSLTVHPTKVTYRRSARNIKRTLSSEACELVQKKAKHYKGNENITQVESCQVESCLEGPPDLQEI